MTWQIALTAIAALVATAAAPVVLLPWLKRRGHYDVPGARSSHQVAVPRGGGLALLFGVAVGMLALHLWRAAGHGANPTSRLWPLVGIPFAMGALGFLEDVHELGIRTRLLGQFVLSGAGACWLLASDHRTLLWVVPAGLAIAGYVNAANFMDGVNGISGLHGLVAGVAFLLLGNGLGDTTLQLAAALLAASSLGFLPWNAPRARVFLGDCGSYYIGAAVATLAITAVHAGAPLELAVAPTSVYLVDTAWTLWSRYRRGEALSESHRSHVYQRLTDCGLTHLESAGVVAAATMAVVSLSWFGLVGGFGVRLLCDLLALILLTAYLALPAVLQIRPVARRPVHAGHGA
jgi:UDP-GlcNAc:undecaprenyl-phosphate GlcNAc-1-phosphate transferase